MPLPNNSERKSDLAESRSEWLKSFTSLFSRARAARESLTGTTVSAGRRSLPIGQSLA